MYFKENKIFNRSGCYEAKNAKNTTDDANNKIYEDGEGHGNSYSLS